MERWRLFVDLDGPPAFQMGLDEALLLAGGDEPVLRLYSFLPDALSLGYFQRFADVPAAIEAERTGAPTLLRRITGGGAIHHCDELTFAIVCPLAHPLYAGPVAASYARVHEALAAALAATGVQAHLRGEDSLRSDRRATGMCFHESTALDLVWGERKGVGSAQRRTGGRVLHHGSIKVGASALEAGVATLRTHAPRLTVAETADVLLAELSRALGVEWIPADERAPELELAGRLAPRYTSPAFVHRR